MFCKEQRTQFVLRAIDQAHEDRELMLGRMVLLSRCNPNVSRCPSLSLPLTLLLLMLWPLFGLAQDAILPPEQPWNGASQALIAPAGDPWITPAEQADFRRTPRYDATVAWLQRLELASAQIHMVPLGQSPEGREIWMVIASQDQAFTPEALRATGKPTLLAQAGIHSGEIDGKDAGLMLLRDLTVRGTQKKLLEQANLLLVPLLNVDGHERFSRYARINQRGPEESGWRTNARNLNLNRDYTKLDTPEIRAIVHALNMWQPDLYVDMHVTDGADYQYDITWTYNGPQGHSPSIAKWLDQVLSPAAFAALQHEGHIPAPFYITLVEDLNPNKGRTQSLDLALVSTGYGDVRHVPTILVETHSLKPYHQRVLGTYMFLKSALETLGQGSRELRQAIQEDRDRRPATQTLSWKQLDKDHLPPSLPKAPFQGIEYELVPSAISGTVRVIWTGRPVELHIPVIQLQDPEAQARRPKAYWVPSTWPEVIERLRWHGVAMETLTEAREVEVERLKMQKPVLARKPHEGHIAVCIADKDIEPRHRRQKYAPGSVRVPTDQALGDLAMVLLEPASPDSFFHWGFFLEILQRTEYAEDYVMEPIAEKMLASNPQLAEEFKHKLLEDNAFRSDPKERLDWFYTKTPYFDDQWQLYPVGREEDPNNPRTDRVESPPKDKDRHTSTCQDGD